MPGIIMQTPQIYWYYLILIYRYHSAEYLLTNLLLIYRQAFHIQVKGQCSDDQNSCQIVLILTQKSLKLEVMGYCLAHQ